jgi:hypothetical protein
VTAPNIPDPAAAAPSRRRWWPVAWVGLALAWLVVRLPGNVVATARELPTEWRQAQAALTQDATSLIQASTGMPLALQSQLRSLPPAARLVLFLPYPGDGAEALLRLQWERVKNLLYPRPREVSFARKPADMASLLVARNEGRLFVLDGTQEDIELPLVAEFQLLGTYEVGSSKLRLWQLVKVPR